jgi:hypothetical protein
MHNSSKEDPMRRTLVLLILVVIILVAWWQGLLTSSPGVTVSNILKALVRFVLVPILLLGGVCAAGYVAWLPSEIENLRISKVTAFILGIVIAGLVAILNPSSDNRLLVLTADALPDKIGFTVAGVFLAPLVLGAIYCVLHTRGISFFIALLSSGGLIALYLHVLSGFTSAITFITLGFLTGALTGLVIFPGALKVFLPPPSQAPQ